MRKSYLLMSLLIIATIVSCARGGNDNPGENDPGGNGAAANNVEGSLPEILQRIYDNYEGPELPGTFEEELTHEGTEFNPSVEYFIGSEEIPFKDGLVSESAFGGGYSVVLLRMEENADIKAAKEEIAEKVDPWKWICMGVEAEDVIVDSKGDLVILIMSENSKELHDAFLKL